MPWVFSLGNHYWQVLDRSPATTRFSSQQWFAGAATSYLSTANATYLAWVASGGQETVISTNDEVTQVVSNYLLSVAGNLMKLSCDAASAGSIITLSGEQTVDGIALIAGQRCLVKDNAPPSQNGIYLVQAGAWIRAYDALSIPQLVGATVFITGGTVNNDTTWVCQAEYDYVLGVDNINWRLSPGNITPAALSFASPSQTIAVYDAAGAGPGIISLGAIATSAFTNVLGTTIGIIVQTGTTDFAKRSIAGTSQGIDVANANGTAGNMTISLSTTLNFTSKTVSGGTFTQPTINNPTVSTGTFTNPTVTTGTFTQPTINNPTIATGTIGTSTISNSTIATATINNSTIDSATFIGTHVGPLTINGSVSAGTAMGFYMGTVPAVKWGGGYTQIYDPGGTVGISIGSSDPTIYFDNTTSQWRARGSFASIYRIQTSTIYVAQSNPLPAGGSTGMGILISTASNFGIFVGSGAPTLVAGTGSIYMRSDGSSATTRMYSNVNGSTSWTAIVTSG